MVFVNGWAHLAIGLCFFAGTFLIDVDHVASCNRQELAKAFNGEQNECSRGFLHNPLILYCLVALTLGLALHLYMDKII